MDNLTTEYSELKRKINHAKYLHELIDRAQVMLGDSMCLFWCYFAGIAIHRLTDNDIVVLENFMRTWETKTKEQNAVT